MNSFQALRERRHAQWLTRLKEQIWDVVNNQAEPAPQIYLFGSRARGDWDGFSDTDLLVVAATKEAANHWADLLLDHGVAQDVMGLDQQAWVQLPNHPSVIWRHVARDAVSRLEPEPTA